MGKAESVEAHAQKVIEAEIAAEIGEIADDVSGHRPPRPKAPSGAAAISKALTAAGKRAPEIITKMADDDGVPAKGKWRHANPKGKKIVSIGAEDNADRPINIPEQRTVLYKEKMGTETLSGSAMEIPGVGVILRETITAGKGQTTLLTTTFIPGAKIIKQKVLEDEKNIYIRHAISGNKHNFPIGMPNIRRP